MSKHTPGPWRWELNQKSKQVQLCGGVPQFDLIVMDFTRWGMGGAAIRLREDVDRMNIMERCDKWAKSVAGREHHASWFQDIDHPDARLIAAAPDLLAACKSALEELKLKCECAASSGCTAAKCREDLTAAINKAEGSNV